MLTLTTSVLDLKLAYRVLHQHLQEHLELMDSDLFTAMQDTLQQAARADGVDVGDHAAWDAWLGHVDAQPCDVRMAGRRVLGE